MQCAVFFLSELEFFRLRSDGTGRIFDRLLSVRKLGRLDVQKFDLQF